MLWRNQQIQTTIQLGLGETSAGSSFTGQSLNVESAANNALLLPVMHKYRPTRHIVLHCPACFPRSAVLPAALAGRPLAARPVLWPAPQSVRRCDARYIR